MIYDEKDIDFRDITPKEFENLCYELVVSYNFQDVIWRQGGADNGRDIEGKLYFNLPFVNNHCTKWFFECKHHANGVSPENFNSKIAWAEAEKPDFLVFFVTSYTTNNAKTWLEKMQINKIYKIIVIEGEELKRIISLNQSLIERYFTKDKHIKLYQELKRQNSIYHIYPSIESIRTFLNAALIEKFEKNDLGFIMMSVYASYYTIINAYEYEYINKDIIYPLLNKLKQNYEQSDIYNLLSNYHKKYNAELHLINNVGFPDEYYWHVNNISEKDKKYPFYYAKFAPFNKQKHYYYGFLEYIFFSINKQDAVEILVDCTMNHETHYCYYENYNKSMLKSIFNKFVKPPFADANDNKDYPKSYIDKLIDYASYNDFVRL